MNDRADTFDALLRHYDVAQLEYDVLMTIGYEILVPYEELASWTMREGQRPEQTVSLADYDRAVEVCFAKGWLKILSAEDCERDKQLWTGVPYPKCSFAPYEPGLIDFTYAGAQLNQHLNAHLFGWYPLRHSGASFNTDTSGQIEIYSTARKLCSEERRAIQQNPELYTGGKANVVQSSAIHLIGPWWMSRWRLMPKGYHASVRYQLMEAD